MKLIVDLELSISMDIRVHFLNFDSFSIFESIQEEKTLPVEETLVNLPMKRSFTNVMY